MSISDHEQRNAGSVAKALTARFQSKWQRVRTSQHRQKGPKAPRTLVAETFRIPARSAERILGALPEMLLAWSEAHFDHRSWLEFYPSEALRDIERLKGVLLCHTLSPTPDSVALLAELGRCLRVAGALGLPLRVMLAGTTWARFNWVVMDLSAESELHTNHEFRSGLYRSLNLKVDECEVHNVQFDVHHNQLNILATEYVRVSEAIWGSKATGSRLSTDEAQALLNRLELRTLTDASQDLLKLRLVNEVFGPVVDVIRTVLENLKRLDKPTFMYFLLQYFHQAAYLDHLKVAVRRERDFDEPFRRLLVGDERIRLAYQSQVSAYFSDYYFAKFDDGSGLTVHPYYFPSGRLYSKYSKLEEARQHCLMMDDTDTDKVKNSLAAMSPLDRGRFLSDMLSFAHGLSLQKKGVHGRIQDWFRATKDKSMLRSWDLYAVEYDDFRTLVDEWTPLVFTSYLADEIPPFHFLPYVWESVGVTLDDEAVLVLGILEATRAAVFETNERYAKARNK